MHGIIKKKTMMEAEISKLKKESIELKRVVKTVAAIKARPSKGVKNVPVEKKSIKDLDSRVTRKVKELEAEKVMMETEISKLRTEASELKEVVKLLMSSRKAPVPSTSEAIMETPLKKTDTTNPLKDALKEEVAKPPSSNTPSKPKAKKPSKSKANTTTEPNSKKVTELSQDEMEKEEKGVKPVLQSTVEPKDNPWGLLKESTLKRKTKAQLSDYLTERKIDFTGMQKAEMVSIIKNI